MIPLQLRVSNFMCYRDNVPPLDFDGIHIASLTGANGHGKSALLDAMTWALWGKARAKRDDDLIHLGQSEMEVEFTFDLGGTVYRVLRKRDSSKRGRTILDLQVRHGGEFRSIAETGVRATQEAIIRLLRMDYDTFTNSAFLLQGRADAFTTRTPAERKRVLGEILSLSQYDEYEQRAKELAKERKLQVAELDGALRDIDRELARRPEYEAGLAQARAQVAELAAAVKEAEAALQVLQHQQQLLEQQQARLRDLDRRLSQAERELAEVESSIDERQKRLAGYEATLGDRQRVEEGYANLVAAREAEAGWNEKLARHAQVQAQQRTLERAIDAARHQLDMERGRWSERLQELDRRKAEGPGIEQELSKVRALLEHLTGRQAEKEQTLTAVQSLAEESAALKVGNEQMLAEMEELRDKLDLLSEESAEAECPLCGQSLSDAHRVELHAQFETQGKALGDAHRANSARQREIDSDTQRLQQNARRLDGELKAQPAQQRREAQLDRALAETLAAAGEAGSAQTELAAVDHRLQSGDFAADEQAGLARLSGELDALGYDRAAHEAARARVADLSDFEATYSQLQMAIERVDDERGALKDLRVRQARWQESVTGDREERASLASSVEALPRLTAKVKAQSTEVDDLRSRSSRARQSLGAAQQRLDYCDRLVQERQRRVKDRQRVAEEKGIFDELRLAFGKRGIQAMIIEAAIPEIEFEANKLLARMTGGRMHVRFETQRETLKGDTVETLDINIADELGTRPYELFSGGEAFRVNFAIRIALSKLLARRAGAQLQMLIIDEGFGTQDAEGRERLVEAINSIQGDFARILVITHIEELKEAFPVRIEVLKTDLGSRFSVA